MSRVILVVVFAAFFILVDMYVFQAIRSAFQGLSVHWRRAINYIFWAITAFSIIWVLIVNSPISDLVPEGLKRMVIVGIAMIYFSKIFGVLTLLIDDIFKAFSWIYHKIFPINITETTPKKGGMTRSAFIGRTSLVAVAAPLATFGFGIVSGAHNYRVRRRTIHLPNLPSAFDGLRIGQLSDIHTGSFFNRSGVARGVDLLLSEKPDVVFFTGDLVNDRANEVKDYKDLFSKIQAPLGVFSTLGNHDYGDYTAWPSMEAKRKNLQHLIQIHRDMNWDILMNENRTLRVDGQEIAILGIENWGAGRFSKYGKLDQAYRGTEDKAVKLLLSHDPSHWDAQVRKDYPDIDVMFAGHTHGFQFGVEIGNYRWSPSKYIYKQWADLYQEGQQYIYVNRGFGFLGYPGRIGILPELTVIELKKA